jgi:anti-sigma-K factor RskA
MNNAQHIPQDDLALIALQLLPKDEMDAALLHLEHCDACREELAKLQGDLAIYALSSEMHSPPAQARERLMRRVAKEKKIVPVERPQPMQRPAPHSQPTVDTEIPLSSAAVPVVAARREDLEEPMLASRSRGVFAASNAAESSTPSFGAVPTFGSSPSFGSSSAGTYDEPTRRTSKVTSIAAWTGWAIAAGAAVVAGMQFHQRDLTQSNLDATTAKLTQTSADAARAQQALSTLTADNDLKLTMHVPTPEGVPQSKLPEGHAAYDADKGSLVFVATNLLPVPSEKTYELWVLPNDGKAAPIPAGIFRPDQNGSASVVLPDIPKGVDAKGFGVTLEDAGGTKTPTMAQLVLVGM